MQRNKRAERYQRGVHEQAKWAHITAQTLGLNMNSEQVTAIRPNLGGGARARSGVRMRVPPGDTVVSLVRYGMTLKNLNAVQIARQLRISTDAYAFVRKLLILKDREILNGDELVIVNDALDTVNQELQIRKAQRMTSAILAQHWKRKTANGLSYGEKQLEIRRRQRLERLLFVIEETCTNNEELEIPQLTKNEREAAITILISCISGLSQLISTIEKGKHHE